MERGHILAQYGACVALGVEGDEERLHVFALRAERTQHCPDHGEVGWADVGAVGIAEIEQHQLAAELHQASAFAPLIRERKRPPDRRLAGHELVHQARRIGPARIVGPRSRQKGNGRDNRK